MSGGAILERARLDPYAPPVLLHAGSCPRCRLMARLIVTLSSGTITGIALSEAEWRDFYAHELPESRGSPVLLHRGTPVWGPAVFVLAPWIALAGMAATLRRRWRR